uniref:Uncharacterized protein n=1 Tax=Ananas comosus var. bracteatus TaxID=296719 RepID=A0A6V7PQ90_ANACO|nr:unnamed protein product [Ananas comosus var. bracteatus]
MGRSKAPVAETSTVVQPSTAQHVAPADNEGQGESDRHRSNRERLVDLEAQLNRLDEKVTKVAAHEERVTMLVVTLAQLVEQVAKLQDNTMEAVHHLKEQTIELFARVNLLTKAMSNAPPTTKVVGMRGVFECRNRGAFVELVMQRSSRTFYLTWTVLPCRPTRQRGVEGHVRDDVPRRGC